MKTETEEDVRHVDTEVVEEPRELARPSVPTTINELAALDKERGVAIVEQRLQIFHTMRTASLQLTMPNDYVLFNADGRITAFLSDSGCDRVKKLWGISVRNLGKPERIESPDGTFAYRITGDGSCGLTGEAVFDMEGVRYSDERYALEKPDGIQREVAVQKAARANLDGGITRELAGLKSIPIEELDKAWDGTWKKSSMCAKGRGFGSKAERAGASVQQSEIPPEFQPKCSTCNSPMKYIPAGKTQQGKPYEAFWSCPSKEHKSTMKHEQALANAKAEAGQRQPGEE